MAEIRWTEEAHRWLKDIFDYIATDHPEAAQKVVADIYEKSQRLLNSLKSVTSTDPKRKTKSVSCFTDITVSPT